MISKFISLIVGFVYIFAAFSTGEGDTIIFTFINVIICLGLIWLPDYFASYGGPTWPVGRASQRITASSPPSLVAFMGWVLLLLPFISAFLIATSS